jgi:DNA (cytosine-5)-methyltransferase 1
MGDPTTDNYVVTGGFFDRPDVAPTLRAGRNRTGGDRPYGTDVDTCDSLQITHSPRANGFDASEDGTGRGTPLVPVGFMPARTFGKDGGVDSRYAPRDVCDALHTASGGGNKAPLIAFQSKQSSTSQAPSFDEISPTLDIAKAGGIAIAIQERAICENPLAGPDGIGIREDNQAYTVEARQVPQTVAYGISNQPTPKFGANVMPTLNSHNLGAGMQEAVAFNLRGRDGGSQPELTDQASLRSASGGSSRTYVAPAMAVRRLTPTECERLQDFPDGYTKIDDKTADGPRYKALGNSMAVCCMAWIGKRIRLIDFLFS